MKKYYTLILSLLLAQGAMAIDYDQLRSSNILDAASKAELFGLQQQEETIVAQNKASNNKLKTLRQQMDNRTIRALIRMTPGSDASTLASNGIMPTTVVNHFAIATISLSQLESLANRPDIESISFGKREKHLLLNNAHASTGVAKIHQGEGLNQPYTGKGVVIGVLDQGFDPNHIMFQDANGKSRFKMIGYAAKAKDSLTYLTTPTDIANFTSDNNTETHATHVSGIAAGNYQGENYQLQGVAPDADLLMGPLPNYKRDFEIFEKMAEWCKENGDKRLVINMSFGMNSGRHDTTDPEVAFMDEIIKKYDIVACIAAGNEADYDIVQRHTFTGDTGEQMKAAIITDQNYDGDTDINEVTDYFTVSDKEQIEIDLALINRKTGEPVSNRTWHLVNSNYPYGRSQKYNNKDLDADVTITSENIGNGMKGYYLTINNLKIKNSQYELGYLVRAQAGQTVTSYLESNTYFNKDIKGCAQYMTHDGTINTIACGTEPIVVGAYNTTVSYKAINGKDYNANNYYYSKWGDKLGDITFFSSYGKLVDGRELPTICAPGLFVTSSLSHYCKNAAMDITKQETIGDTTYDFGAESGTSMSCPYMSGICALWLEADPTLTHTQIRDIAQKTAICDNYCTTDNYFTKLGEGNQAGAGKVDAYAGLKYILDQKTAILSPIADGKDFMVRTLDGCTYEAYIAGATSMTATLYTMEGRQVAATSTPGNTITISAQGQAKGIYVLRLSDGKQTHAQKVVVR